ncbi:MAG: hypothetical protein U5K28_11545 [Halobacteriales archaeon]|nr:hypothetical protein [Halobacteriales archaeon]
MGIGVNADLDPSDPDTDRAVTTLWSERGEPVERQTVATRLHERLLEYADSVQTDDWFADVLDRWCEHAITLDERVRVETREETIRGTATDVTEAGALLVETRDGKREVTDGDCESLRRDD